MTAPSVFHAIVRILVALVEEGVRKLAHRVASARNAREAGGESAVLDLSNGLRI